VFRRVLWTAVLVTGLAGLGRAAEPPKSAVAPNELPTHLIKVLRTTNKAQTNRYVPKVYTVRNTNPYALLRWIRRTAQQEEGAYYFFGKTGESNEVTSGRIMVTLPEYMLPGVDQLMATIDRAGLTSTSGEKFFYYRPKHRHVNDAGFRDLIEAVRGTSGDFDRDDEANMFLVYAAPSKVADVEAVLPLIDAPPPQVMIEVTVYEINVDNESRIGLDYVSCKNGPGRNLFAFQAYTESGHVHKQSGASGADPLFNANTGVTGHFHGRGVSKAYFLDVPSAFFDFLVVKNKARVMTSVKVAARNRIAATIRATDTILYHETLTGPAAQAGVRPDNTALDPNGNNVNHPDNRAVIENTQARQLGALAGVQLVVTPIIGEKEIDLNVNTHVVSHLGFDDKGRPTLASRQVNTQVHCRSGQELVLGGFSREVFLQRADKIPILGSLPLIGYLFGSDGNTTERRQVVIVLTPHNISDFSAMQYSPSKVNAALIKSKALKLKATDVPHTEAGFDQWLLNSEEN